MEVHFCCIIVFFECMLPHSFMCERNCFLNWIMHDHEFNVKVACHIHNDWLIFVVIWCSCVAIFDFILILPAYMAINQLKKTSLGTLWQHWCPYAFVDLVDGLKENLNYNTEPLHKLHGNANTWMNIFIYCINSHFIIKHSQCNIVSLNVWQACQTCNIGPLQKILHK